MTNYFSDITTAKLNAAILGEGKVKQRDVVVPDELWPLVDPDNSSAGSKRVKARHKSTGVCNKHLSDLL